MIPVKLAQTTEDLRQCYGALLAFRPMLQPEMLTAQSQRMIDAGYKILYVPKGPNEEAAAILGYRAYEMFRTGKIIYIDDLFTFPEYRGKGYAGALLDHIEQVAAREGICSIHLDSGYQLHTAHRLYLNKGFELPCHHFSKIIE